MLSKAGSLDHCEKIAGFVLAGGRSSRLGQDKVLLPWNGSTLLDHAMGRLQQVCGIVRVCGNREDLAPPFRSEHPVESPIRDIVPGAGPLAGIVAALAQSQSPWNFFLAVDLPLVPVELLWSLAARAQSHDVVEAGSLCILPQSEGRPQPLCGLYHLSLLPGLRGALEEGKYKLVLALQEAVLRARTTPTPPMETGWSAGQRPALETPASGVELFDAQAFPAIARIGSPLSPSDWFLNINTPQDWRRANELNSMLPPQLPRHREI